MIRWVVLIGLWVSVCSDDHIADYLKFLTKNRDVLGKTGNFKEGEIEVITDPRKICDIEKLQKARCLKQGMSEAEATIASKVGVITEDPYWVVLRDPVVFPTGGEGTYNRLIWKISLDKGSSGVAILPLLPDGKIGAIVTFRHATRSWELEIPRGLREPFEAVEIALKRELEEETGFVSREIIFLGDMVPDSGMASAVVPVFLAKIEKQGLSNQDYSEAILGVKTFTLMEIKEALVRGYIEMNVKGKQEKVWVRDSFLTYALFLAKCKGCL